MTSTQPTPTGAREHSGGADHLVLTRTFQAPIEAVWAAVTEPERLARWIGTWQGDAASGRVDFRMTFEDSMPWEPYVIEVCEEPTRLRVRTDLDDPAEDWTLDLQLSEEAGRTTLRFAQVITEHVDIVDVGPGWEFYLDRLVEAETTGAEATSTWDDAYTSMSNYYRSLAG